MGLTNPSRALGQFSLLLISPKFLTLLGISLFSINSFRLASLLALLCGLNLSFLIGVLACFFKIKKSRSFRVRRGVLQGSVLGSVFSLFSSMIFLLFTFFRQLLSLRLRSGHLVLLPLDLHCNGSHTNSSDSIGALVWVLASSSRFEQMWCLLLFSESPPSQPPLTQIPPPL